MRQVNQSDVLPKSSSETGEMRESLVRKALLMGGAG